MSYELEVIPNRGFVRVGSFRIQDDVTYNHVPTSITGGLRSIINNGFVTKLLYRSFTTTTPFAGATINFNNTDLSLATTAVINSDRFSYSSFDPSKLNYLILAADGNFNNQVSFKVTAISEDTAQTPDHWTLTVEYDKGITSLGDSTVCYIQTQTPFNPNIPRDFYANSLFPLTFAGDQNVINTILQTKFYFNWQNYRESFSLTQAENFNANWIDYGNGELSFSTPVNTSDPLITFTVTKNGIPYDPYTVHLKYKTLSEFNNPNGFPL